MANWPGRGRPRTKTKDVVTPELRRKHQLGLTKEAADLALERGHITSRQHWCALHFRWLYTIKHGLPCPTAINLDGDIITRPENDEEWQMQRELEFAEAVITLRGVKAYSQVLNLSVMNVIPAVMTANSYGAIARFGGEVEVLRAGLDALANLWMKKHQEPAP